MFAYVVSSVPEDDVINIYIDIVLPMVWVDSPKFFCALLKILTDMVNSLVDTNLHLPAYGDIFVILDTDLGPPHTPDILTHIDLYMGAVISTVQGGAEQKHRVFDSTVRAFKWIPPRYPGNPRTWCQ